MQEKGEIAMPLWVSAVLLSVVTGIVTLAAAGAEPTVRVRSFNELSQIEREFDRRVGRLLIIGLVSIGMATAMGLLCVVASLQWLG
jgi:hypothetical protein